jgi:hypothetical protein
VHFHLSLKNTQIIEMELHLRKGSKRPLSAMYFYIMKNNNNSANQQNPNKGTAGTNKAYSANQGNRGKQLNTTPNNANTPKGNGGAKGKSK